MSEPAIGHLTAAEKELWRLLVKGLSYKEIAEIRHTGLSATAQVSRLVYAKMGVKDQEALIRQNWEPTPTASGQQDSSDTKCGKNPAKHPENAWPPLPVGIGDA